MSSSVSGRPTDAPHERAGRDGDPDTRVGRGCTGGSGRAGHGGSGPDEPIVSRAVHWRCHRRSRGGHVRPARIDALNVYYGTFRAVRDITLTIRPQAITAIIGPSGCGKSTFLRLDQPDERGHRQRTRRGQHLSRRHRHLRRRGRPGRSCGGGSGWSSSDRTRSRRCRSTTTSWPACGSTGRKSKAELDEIVERSPPPRRPLGRGQGQAQAPGCRCPAASSSGCASPARSPSIPEVILMDEPALGARSGGDAPDRGADGRTALRATRSSSSPTTCSRPRGSATTPRSSRWATIEPATWWRSGDTATIFTNPKNQLTEDYVSGRFG